MLSSTSTNNTSQGVSVIPPSGNIHHTNTAAIKRRNPMDSKYYEKYEDINSTRQKKGKLSTKGLWARPIPVILGLLCIAFCAWPFIPLPFSNNTSDKEIMGGLESYFKNDDSKFGPLSKERDVLPTNVKPFHYDLRITPDLVKFVFDGHVDIELDILETTDKISLNAFELGFKKVSVSVKDSLLSFEAMNVEINNESQQANIHFPKSIPANSKATLHIDYSGIMNDRMVGFYRSSYIDSITGEKKWLGTTQFEATDARLAFPCWDEPALKATFTVSIVEPKGMIALSNMPEESFETLDNGLRLVKFQKTPIMSTYLLAFVVGELESIETKTARSGILVRVWATKGTVQQGRFGLDVASRTLDFFEEYFGIDYPLPKSDLVAVPDFAAGAMENWGLVTYRTVYLLFDDQSSTVTAKQRVAYVIGHELAHQWFGNLVTMEWWSDLWLNEGFATWVGWLAADQLFPEWDVWTAFVVEDCQEGLKLDSLRSSHPIEVSVKNPSEISQIFDSISYNKGASAIRMLVAWLGNDVFKKGIHSYLLKHKFGNAKTSDLWNALEIASGKPVTRMMETWTRQTGFPVLSVAESTVHDEKKLQLSQQRFLSSLDLTPVESEQLWYVPLNLALKERLNTESIDMLSSATDTITIPAASPYYKFNSEQTGFYRVKYDPKALDKLGGGILAGSFGSADRIGIIADLFSLSAACLSPTTYALDFLQYYVKEDDYLVWAEIASRLADLKSAMWLQSEAARLNLDKFVKLIYGPLVDKLGYEFPKGENDKVSLLRSLAISMAGKSGDERVLKELQTRFEKFVSGDLTALHPNIRGTAYAVCLKYGGKAEFDSILKIYRESSLPDQKLAALGAIGASTKLELIKLALEFALSDEVRPQDIIYPLRSVANALPDGRLAAWEWTKNNWQLFYDRYNNGGSALLARIVTFSTEGLGTIKFAEEIKSFFSDKDAKKISRAIDQSIEKIYGNHRWMTKDAASLAQWLKDYCKQ